MFSVVMNKIALQLVENVIESALLYCMSHKDKTSFGTIWVSKWFPIVRVAFYCIWYL